MRFLISQLRRKREQPNHNGQATSNFQPRSESPESLTEDLDGESTKPVMAARGSRRLPSDNHAGIEAPPVDAEQLAQWLEMLKAEEVRLGPRNSQTNLARRLRRETSDYLTKHLPHRSRGKYDRPREIENPLKTKPVSPVRPHWPAPPSVK